MKHLKTFENNIKTLYIWYKGELIIVPENGREIETEDEKGEKKILDLKLKMMLLNYNNDVFDYLKLKTEEKIDEFFKSLIKIYPKKYIELHEEYEYKKDANKYNL